MAAVVFISPSRYIQGPGELGNLGTHALRLGKKALVLISQGGYKRSGAMIEESFKTAGAGYVFDYFNGECSKKEIDRLINVIKENSCDVVVGIGGGKIFDTAKAAAYYVDVPVMICPTVASTDAPCSALSVIYTEEGAVEEYLFLRTNPDVVLMDTAIIAKSPARLTISGMGDALATYFEARAARRSDAPNFCGGKAGITAMAIAELCFKTLMTEGRKAKIALEAGACTEAVERIVEANTLLSGIGFESGGVAAAHAVHNGFTILPECHHMYHGEKVAFGTITQLVLENVPCDELQEVIGFCVDVGLPVTLEQLGVTDPSREKIMSVAKVACADTDTLHNLPFAVTPEMVADAIFAADAFGRAALKK